MRIYKKMKVFISLVCAFALIFSLGVFSVAASDVKNVTATTGASIKQGGMGTCYVSIDSLGELAALDVTVHFDPAKVKINKVYNSVSCPFYDNATHTDNIKFNYLFDGKGAASQTRLFYFTYQVLSNADVGEAFFDITIGEAYDYELNDVAVMGSRCSFTIAETVTNKTCTISSSSSINTSIEHEFSLAYRFSSYQIASGAAVITYDPELFEVVSVTNGAFFGNKVYDVNTELSGSVYISFAGSYVSRYDLVTVKFKTLKNVTEKSQITFKAPELYDINLNAISCKDFATTVTVRYDNSYLGDAPAMSVSAEYDSVTEKVTAVISLDAQSRLGAGDFVLGFDPALLSLSSYEKGFTPTFFNVNDKEIDVGKLKLSILSLEDITTAETVITVVFDVLASCEERQGEISISGDTLTDSLVKPIALNFIGTSFLIPEKHVYGDWIIDQEATTGEAGSKHQTCAVCGDMVIETIPRLEMCIVRKGQTLEYKEIVYVKMIYDLVNIDLSAIDLSKDAGLLCWTQEEFAALDDVTFDETHALVGLTKYPNSTFYYGKSDGFIARYLAEEYYFACYVKLPDGTYLFSEAVLYGPKTYAYNMIAKSTSKEETKTLCVALLNYATAAQVYFGTEDSDLANADLTEEQKAMNWNGAEEHFNLAQEIPEDKQAVADVDVFEKCGRNLRFKEKVSLLAIYRIDDSVIENATESGTIFWTAEEFAALDGMPGLNNYGAGRKVSGFAKYNTTNTWCSVAPSVAAKDMMDTSYYFLGYVKHSDGSVSYSELMSYTFEQYIFNTTTNASASEEMVELSKRLYYYERAAYKALKEGSTL